MRRIAFVVLILAACSQSTYSPPVAAISVRDLAASARWYQNNAGFALKWERTYPESHLVVATLERDGNRLLLMQLDQSLTPMELQERGYASHVRGLDKIAIPVRDIDALAARLRTNGVAFEVEPRDDLGAGTRSFVVLDAEGNAVRFVGPIPAPTVPDAARMTL